VVEHPADELLEADDAIEDLRDVAEVVSGLRTMLGIAVDQLRHDRPDVHGRQGVRDRDELPGPATQESGKGTREGDGSDAGERRRPVDVLHHDERSAQDRGVGFHQHHGRRSDAGVLRGDATVQTGLESDLVRRVAGADDQPTTQHRQRRCDPALPDCAETSGAEPRWRLDVPQRWFTQLAAQPVEQPICSGGIGEETWRHSKIMRQRRR